MRYQLLVIVLGIAASLPLACGSGGAGNGGSPSGADASTPLDSAVQPDTSLSPDAAPPDASQPSVDSSLDAPATTGDASEDAADAADAAVNTGTLLVSRGNLHLFGITSDGYVVYWAATVPGALTNSVFAVPLAGGTPVTVAGPYTAYFWMEIYGPAVFVWNLGAKQTNISGPLSAWTHAHGLTALSGSSVRGDAVTNKDGSQVLFTTNVTLTQKDVGFANIDGSGSASLLTGVYRSSCPYASVFAGKSVLVQHCDTPLPDGGAVGSLPPTLTLFATALPDAGTTLAMLPANPTSYSWSVDGAGDLVYTATNGAPPPGVVFSIPDASATTIEDAGAAEGLFVSDGGALVYRTTSGAIRRSATAAPSPATLVAAGVAGLMDVSPDETQAIYYTQTASDSSGDVLVDLNIASATAAGGARQLVSTPSMTFLGSDFTADSSYVLYALATLSTSYMGDLYAAPVGAGSTVALATAVTEAQSLRKEQVVLAANYVAATGTADLEIVDLNIGPAATLIAGGVNAGFAMTLDGAQIVYATNAGVPGIYVVNVP